MSPPSSGSTNKPSKKPVWSRWQAARSSSACDLLHAGFLLGLFFDPEGGGDMFLRTSDDFQLSIRRYIPEQRFSTWGTRAPLGYAVRAQKSLDLVRKSLSWLITQQNVYNFIRFVKLFMLFFVFIDIYNLWIQNLMCIYMFYFISIVLSIYTRGIPVTYTFPGGTWNIKSWERLSQKIELFIITALRT
jgi:hypothetical protein